MTTLKEALAAIRSIKVKRPRQKKASIADELLGVYKDILPKAKTSTSLIRDLRNNLYD